MVPELLGFLLGVIAGLVPGVHPNTFASLLLTLSPLLLQQFDSYEVALAIFISSTVYSVVNIIPAVFIGVPDEDTAVAVFPAHRMVMDGDGFRAVSISAFSSFASSALSVPVFYVMLAAGNTLEPLMDLTPAVLISVLVYLVMLERDDFGGSLANWRKRFHAIAILSLSGALGYFTLRRFEFGDISALFPLLSGLFAFPTLVAGMTSSKIPEQRIEIEYPDFGSVFRGVLSGFFVSLFPGISSGVATAISVGRGDDEKRYVSAISSANTSNSILNFSMLLSLGMVRSGTAQAFSELADGRSFTLLPIVALAASFAGLAATLLLSLPAAKVLPKVNPARLSQAVLAFLIVAIYFSCGFDGIAVFSLASMIGVSTLVLGVRRIHCMGAVIVPALLY
ncbi:tripartite tricarboxylate transporter permease [Geoglobus sp.]